MNAQIKEPAVPVEVAGEVAKFLIEKYGPHADSPIVLEGLWLSMQMVGGPRTAAAVIRYCALKVA